MADNPNTYNFGRFIVTDDTSTGDSSSQSSSSYREPNSVPAMLAEVLKSSRAMEKSLAAMQKSMIGMSQSSARDRMFGDSATHFRDAASTKSGYTIGNTLFDKPLDKFLDSFEDTLLKSLVSTSFKNKLNTAMSTFATALGTNLEGLPKAVGKQLARSVAQSQRFQNLSGRVNNTANRAFGRVQNVFMQGVQNYQATQGAGGVDYVNTLKNIGQNIGTGNFAKVAELAQTSSLANAAMAGFTKVITKFGPYAIAAVVAIKALSKAIGPAIEGFKALTKGISQAANREQESRKKNLEYEKQRITEDVNTLIREPFEILKNAAQKVYDAWDSNLRLITGTQGYNKSDLQDLLSAYSERLRASGLTDVVASSSIIENLASVLKSGLSGAIAEEFAYQATILNAAIPTQDFFSYAATYSSIAANAVKNGMANADAIAAANRSLSDFANSLLYASRELSGGFTTGLQNAEQLYTNAAKIAQAARTGNTAEIAGVLTSVSAIVGAIAPDLATSLTDAVYSAATGGNASSLVALRSLAGVNASNTEFLQALATNPKQVFSNLFRNLAAMYTSSGDAYMEKAEGYAELFGLSAEAFQRVDFKYLADAISAMNTSSDALEQNLELLASGQTTLTKEQLVNRQINQYMLEEGLTYVLDNEAARSIQEHMWNEQIAREMMEAQYGVELRGAGLEFLEGIVTSVQNILNLLNPISWLKKAVNVVGTANEAKALREDIAKVLELGKVGSGNAGVLRNLTSTNQNLNLVSNLVEMLGGTSSYAAASSARLSRINLLNNASLALFGGGLGALVSVATGGKGMYGVSDSARNLVNSIIVGSATSGLGKGVGSSGGMYRWGMISKSSSNAVASYLQGLAGLSGLDSALVASATASPTSTSQAGLQAKLQKMMSDEYMKNFISDTTHKSYEEWAASAKQLGITDFAKAVEAAGYTENQMKMFYEGKETEAGAAAQHEEREHQYKFRETGMDFWSVRFPKDFQDPLFALLTTTNDLLSINNATLADILLRHDTWLENWSNFKSSDKRSWDMFFDNIITYGEKIKEHTKNFADYFIRHIYYDASGYNYSDVLEIQQKERAESGDAIYALAEALSKNTVDLRDPAVQTNAILAEILKVVNAIMTQNNNTAGAVSLSDTLAALSMGITHTV